jgi:hypothetical protein
MRRKSVQTNQIICDCNVENLRLFSGAKVTSCVSYCTTYFLNQASCLREDLSAIISLPNMQLFLSHPRSSCQSSFEYPSRLCFSQSNNGPAVDCCSIGLHLKFVKMKSLIRGCDRSVKSVIVSENFMLFVVNVSFESSSDCENDICMSNSGIEAANLIAHLVQEEEDFKFEAAALPSHTNRRESSLSNNQPA